MRNLILKAHAWRAHRPEEGQTVLEYALIAAAVSIVLVAILVGIGSNIVQGAVDAVNAFNIGGS